MSATYLRVATSQIVADMTRYLSYNGVPESPEPIQVGPWASSGRKVTVHRVQIGEYTYFRRPSVLNSYWTKAAVERYRSFGVQTQMISEAELAALPRD